MKVFLSFYFLLFLTNAFAQIGVGTSQPVNKLHVVADTVSPAKSGNSQNSILRISNSSNNQVLDYGISKDDYSWIQSRNSIDYSLQYPLILNPVGGNVGIGTNNPTQKLTVDGNIQTTGALISSATGQLLNTKFLDESDLGVSNQISNASTSETTVFNYSYTPISSSSKIYVEFDARAWFTGSTSDEFASNLYVGGTKIQTNSPYFSTGTGGGGRGNSLFPILGYYTNSGSSTLTISVKVQRVSSDDTINVFPDMTLIIQEVAQ